MTALYGWRGKVLCINLTDRSFSVMTPAGNIYHEFIGGRGIAGWLLRRHCTGPWNSPDTPLIFFTGPLTGTASPTSARFTVMSKSPLTGTIMDCSAGGNFGVELKSAGWDGIVITGCAQTLCGVTLKNGSVEFSDASSLAGRSVSETFSSLPGIGSSAAIGPAAEYGVLFANIVFSGPSFAGRGGLGLVMASKNLKYIHVEGGMETPVFSDSELSAAVADIMRLTAASPVLGGESGFPEYGTGALYDLIHSRRMMPADNFRKTQFPGAERMNAWHYRKKFSTGKTGCAGCHILCKKTGTGVEHIPEYDTMAHFSALIGNTDIERVIEASAICDEAGMDSISAASTIACYMEINGLTCDKTDFTGLLRDISLSRGDGELLKLGSHRYASLSGRGDLSMSVKGLELPAYDPRGAYGIALAYAVSTRGGCCNKGYPVSHEILRKPVATDRFSFSGKGRIIKLSEDINAAADSLTSCRFIFFTASLEEYSRAFRAVTGVSLYGADLAAAGERICYNERIMNALNGFTSADDDLPARFFEMEGSSGGGIRIPAIDRGEFLEARRKYYRIRGLTQDGEPAREKCEELGLEWTD